MALLDPQTWSGSIFSGGWREAAGGDQPVTEPATGDELERVGSASPADVADACARAASAQAAWSAAPFDERAAVLRRAAALMAANAEEIQGWIVRETGGIPPKAALETDIAGAELDEAAALASAPYGELLRSHEPRVSMARRVPAGVVGVISPFNFPLILSTRSVAPALAVGNAVVLKPDPRTAVAGGIVLARLFEEAGLPEGVLHVLPGGADAGAAVVEDPRVRIVSFTGSTASGRKVGTAAARLLKRVHLELGGNSALVVLDDADLEPTVSAAAFGSFVHQGQVCMTTGRHIVHADVADEYVERLAEKASHLPVGNPATDQVALGPVIDAGQRDRIHGLVTASVESGARVAAGGTYDELFYQPTVLTEVAGTPAWREEIFGPVAPVASFTTEEEAVALAADTGYGLSLGIITRDVMKGVALADRIPSGIVHINDQTVGDEAVAPFGGVGDSGTGSRLGGLGNLEAFTETQWMTIAGEVPPYPF